jgi:hypothetical protein
MMMNAEHTKVIEINGIKMEVDLRTARRIENFRVGDAVKILLTGSSYSSPEVHPGVIVNFEDFPTMPTIVVAYVKQGYGGGLEFAYVNAKSADKYELVASTEDSQLAVSKSRTLEHLDREIEKHHAEIKELESKRKYFLERFGVYFGKVTEPA